MIEVFKILIRIFGIGCWIHKMRQSMFEKILHAHASLPLHSKVDLVKDFLIKKKLRNLYITLLAK
jgi:hypothetical protein